jgi:hypothetical protein
MGCTPLPFPRTWTYQINVPYNLSLFINTIGYYFNVQLSKNGSDNSLVSRLCLILLTDINTANIQTCRLFEARAVVPERAASSNEPTVIEY